MNCDQAKKHLESRGYHNLTIDKADGVWYLIGDEEGIDHSVERCLHICRLEDLTIHDLDWKLGELFHGSDQ